VVVIDSGRKSALQDKKRPPGLLLCWTAFSLRTRTSARTGLLDLPAGKSERASNFLCSTCKFLNLCVVVNGVWCLWWPFTLMKACKVGRNRWKTKKTYSFALRLWYWIYLIMKRMSFSKCLWYIICMVRCSNSLCVIRWLLDNNSRI